MLRQATNEIKIEGYLSEVDLKYGSYVKNGETIETVGGSIKVLVEQQINGQDVALEVPVYMFSGKYTKNNTINPAYESIEKVMKEFTSIAAAGSKEGADKVRITKAQLRMNEFFNQNKELVSTPRVNASFVSKVVGEFKPQATFVLEFMVSDVHRVVDKDGVELDPAKVEVTAIVPQYGGKVDVCKLYATNPNVINAVEQFWETGESYRANGRLNFSSTTQIVEEEVGFGEAVERVKTTHVSEFVVTGGSQEPLEGDFAFSVDEIKEAMAERKTRLEALKDKSATRQAPAPTSSKGKLDLGF